MLKLIIEDDEGRKTVVPFIRDEITIGRQEGNTIRLTERNVSRRHARLFRQNGSVLVEDLGSYNGVRVNGERVVGHAAIHDGDLIEIGDYDLELEGAGRVANGHISPNDVTPPHGATLPVDGEGATVAIDQATIEAVAAPVPKELPKEDESPKSIQRPVRELSAEESPRLVALSTDLAGREFRCQRTEMRIGRTSENDISLEHRSLSRSHAKLVREDSGEWRIIDLRSANGLLVNGERYAEATLSHLDTIELGHVKLKFVAAGEPFSLLPGVEESPKSRRPRLPALVGGVAAAVLAGAAAAFFALARPEKAPPPPDLSLAEEGAVPAPKLAAPAVDVEAKAELVLRSRLERAAKAIDDGKLDEAKALLEQAVATVAFQDQHRELTARLADARRQRDEQPKRTRERDSSTNNKKKKAEAKPASASDEAKPPALNPGDEAKKLYEEGLALFTRKQNREARDAFKRCLEVDGTFARCHLMAGSASARLGEADVGARHYEMFLKLAPSAPEAHKVRAFLDDYHHSKQRDSN